MKITFFKNGSKLYHAIEHRTNLMDWILIPGGPGMGPEYMIELANSLLRIEGSFSVFDLPITENIDKLTDEEIIEGWKCDLIECVKIYKNPVIVGHSFGGMFSLSIPSLTEKIKGIVLSNCSPDLKYKEYYATAFERLGSLEMEIQAQKFSENSSSENLKLLFKSWIPFFFNRTSYSVGNRLLDHNTYNPNTFKVGMRSFLNSYCCSWQEVKIPTLIVSGEFDQITPIQLFDNSNIFLNSKKIIIKRANHFPWVENLLSFEKAMLSFQDDIRIRT